MQQIAKNKNYILYISLIILLAIISACNPTTPAKPVVITISPTSINLNPEESQQFNASVTGSTNKELSWSATGGSISQTGLYKAANQAGKYTVTATSRADSTKSASAIITINSTALDIDVSPNNTKVVVFDSANNKVAGFTGDKKLEDLKADDYTIKASLEGYEPNTTTTTLASGEIKSISITLKAIPNTGMNLNLSPDSSHVTISGPNGYSKQFTGDKLLINLSPGKYTLAATATNYRDKTIDIDIVNKQVKEVELSLTAKTNIDLIPFFNLAGVSPSQPVGTTLTIDLGVQGHIGKNLPEFKLKFYWKEPGQANFTERGTFYFKADAGLVAVPLPSLKAGQNILRLVVDVDDIINEDNELNNTVEQIFIGTTN